MSTPAWSLSGLLFENCSCQLVCPAHISFKQSCTHERCIGHWSIHVDRGSYGDVDLSGCNILILYDAPQRMYEGGWNEVFFFDEAIQPDQREALDIILTGKAGGPWQVLSRFVSKHLKSRVVSLHFEDQGREKRMWIDGVFETEISAIRAKDDRGEALLVNLFNQIHSERQVLARGSTRSFDSEIAFEIENTHALYSEFSWSGLLPLR